eukprot:6213337-Pleurochrysis_carterae.AAC.3
MAHVIVTNCRARQRISGCSAKLSILLVPRQYGALPNKLALRGRRLGRESIPQEQESGYEGQTRPWQKAHKIQYTADIFEETRSTWKQRARERAQAERLRLRHRLCSSCVRRAHMEMNAWA